MKRAAIVGGGVAILLGLVIAAYLALKQNVAPATPTSTASTPSTVAAEAHPGFLYGRITLTDGATYEGRLRLGGNQEAFWGDYFNGFKSQNPWAAHVPSERLRKEPRPIKIFGITIASRAEQIDLVRPLMARFGDITRIELLGRNVRVTLKSGAVFDADWYSSNDLDDGLRVWDGSRGILDFGARRIRAIDFLPAAPASPAGMAPQQLHGTVRTRQGDFTGFVQWNRNKGVGTDELSGRTANGNLSLRFDSLRSIVRHSSDSSLVTLLEGREIVLSGSREAGKDNLGIYVDDRRYGRVLISWDAFERLDFSPGGNGPAYGDFPPGHQLTGSVTTRDGRRLTGRLVYDIDESETTETLDAPSQGVDYTIPFGLIGSIVLPDSDERGTQRARVTLHNGEELQLECRGDLGEGNPGLLIFGEGSQSPEYVLWTDVERVDFHRPPSMYPPQGARSITGTQAPEVDGKSLKAKGTGSKR
ncbi:MAG: hypothetical protein SF339_24560 [Blastocatellia bacterium]|nr:hypothetical protein [Blastocatellia bacterium]